MNRLRVDAEKLFIDNEKQKAISVLTSKIFEQCKELRKVSGKGILWHGTIFSIMMWFILTRL
jgi:hypothetical protein